MFKIVNQSNYLAKVIRLDNSRKHSNADRLLCWNVDYKNVITDLSYNNGEAVIYFPELSQINPELLSYLNLYNDKTLNQDPTVSGYFSHKGIVKTQNFRGEKSEGFVLKFNAFKQWLDTKDIGLFVVDTYINQEFDYIGEIQICNKYEPPVRNSGTQPSLGKKQKVSDILIPNQFRFHVETSHLEKNLHNFSPESNVIITHKLHGSSCILAKVKGKRQLAWYEKLLLRLGVKIVKTEYVDIYSSGKPKSGLPKGIIGHYTNNNKDYYASNIWKRTYEEFKDALEPGITLYGEIVGQGVQGNYDYSKLHNMDGLGFLVYRITRTNDFGIVDEFTWDQIEAYCKQYKVDTVPVLYRGTLDKLSVVEETIIDSLRRMWLEKSSVYCENNVPEEGIVVRTDVPFQAYKLVSFAYKQKESLDAENGIVGEES